MTVCLHVVACVGLVLAASVAAAQEYPGSIAQGVLGYTSIYYDPDTLEVTAYSETDIYGYGLYYYEPVVGLTACGTSASKQAQFEETISVWVTLQCQGTAGQTYVAYGEHFAEIDEEYWQLQNDDIYGLEDWDEFDVLAEFGFPFTSFSPETDPDYPPMITLGETYDMAYASIPASCGANDPRNNLIQEYVQHGTPHIPKCSEFVQSISDPHFTFNQLNSGTYTWAIIRSYFLADLDQLYGLAGSFTINSAYRNPDKEYTIDTQNGGVYYRGSRHQYGDAVDIATTQSTWPNFHTWGKQLAACVEPHFFQGNYGHAHLDWRTQATVGPHYSQCPPSW